jgi:ATP adenylyltransferase
MTSATIVSPRGSLDPVSGCRFCGYLKNGAASPEQWAVVAETERVVAVPSVGPLIPGWLLVMPKQHALSFGAMDSDTLAALLVDIHRIAAGWHDLFGPLTWFEHGPAEARSSAGCGIDHAHLHLVPTGHLDLLAGARDLFAELVFTEIAGLEATADPVAAGDAYLYLRTPGGHSWLARSRDIPSQAFRRVIAHQQGHPAEYDWMRFPHLDALETTCKLARGLNLPAPE